MLLLTHTFNAESVPLYRYCTFSSRDCLPSRVYKAFPQDSARVSTNPELKCTHSEIPSCSCPDNLRSHAGRTRSARMPGGGQRKQHSPRVRAGPFPPTSRLTPSTSRSTDTPEKSHLVQVSQILICEKKCTYLFANQQLGNQVLRLIKIDLLVPRTTSAHAVGQPHTPAAPTGWGHSWAPP